MAVLLTKIMGQLNEERKPMFPLFEKPSKAIKPETKTTTAPQQTIDIPPSAENVPRETAVRGNKKPKKSPKDDSKPPPSGFSTGIPLTGNLEQTELLEVDPNDGRRKRQKTALPKDGVYDDKISDAVQPLTPARRRRERQPKASSSNLTPEKVKEVNTSESMSVKLADKGIGLEERQLESKNQVSLEIGTSKSAAGEESDRQRDFTATNQPQQPCSRPSIAATNDGPQSIEDSTNPPAESKLKKILHFNPKTGTIGSPPARKVVALTDHTKPRSHSRVKQPKSRLIIIHYGRGALSTSAIGLQLDRILKGTETFVSTLKEQPPPDSKPAVVLNVGGPTAVKATNTAPAKPAALHPFFSGKPVKKPPAPKETTKAETGVINLESPQSTSLGRTGPASRRKPNPPSMPTSSSFAGFPGFGSSAKLLKFPGAVEPAWPWKGMVHIRGNEQVQESECQNTQDLVQLRSKSKKSKYQAIQILAKEDIIGTLATDLCIGQVLGNIEEIDLDDYPQVSSCLRVPIKHFESGYDLQKRVRKELNAPLPLPHPSDEESSEDDIKGHDQNRAIIHPALSKTYTSITTSLTAFDRFQYETQPWTQKHSPTSAAEVLQIGREAVILKEWLQKLTVMSVETRSSDRPNSRASSVSRRSALSKSDLSGKRKRKSKKLDGFVVSSGEEDDDMDEISEPEDDPSPQSSQGLLKTVIKASKDTPKLGNAVLISGPHGCGKTAAVHAVAKELGFEVFEINSSSRRSGKDILERVGDMTRNHLVQHSSSQAPIEALDEDAQRISDALADDIKSGRQGTMNSFFKPKAASNPSLRPKTTKPTAKTTEPAQVKMVPKAPPKRQKQSLILFEEVDVLYEEDKGFWATVMGLVVQSKRPIIMTCKDESLVPTQALSLHAILRFKAPPIDLATDYMLSVAANEGHALERNAVKSLYQSRHFDLRASLTELNFWCQFAVGDTKGGLDWICPRWPLGCDVDMLGNTIRVVSEKTYEAGMGWLSQDFLESHAHYLDIEEETLHEAWDGWHLDLGDWEKSIDMAGWANKTETRSGGKVDESAILRMYSEFADAMSAADLCSGSSFAPDNQVPLDITIPELSAKARDDYTLEPQLLEASPLLDYSNTRSNLAFWMKSRARKHLQIDQHVKHGLEVPSELDRPSEVHVISLIRDQISSPEFILSRRDLSAAFDPISAPKTYVWTTGPIEASVFDGTKTVITTELAPYVRSIVSYDAKLQEERLRMSNLLSEGGWKGKRMRTTRAAMSALEGGARSTTRKDKYFGPTLNPHFVFKTGMPSWLEAASAATPTNVGRRLSMEDSDMSKVESEGQDDEMIENSP